MVTPNRDTIDTGPRCGAAHQRIQGIPCRETGRSAGQKSGYPAECKKQEAVLAPPGGHIPMEKLCHETGYLLWYGISRGVHGTGITEPLLNTLILYSRIYKNSSCF